MTAVNEVEFPTGPQGALRQGLDVLDLGQEVSFRVYERVVLPVDGFVFWRPTTEMTLCGSLHTAVEWQQNQDEAMGLSNVVFSAENRVQQFSNENQNKIFVAAAYGMRFAFAAQGGYYAPSSLWHYVGRSVFPALASQLLDPPYPVDLTRAVISNSTPFWLQLSSPTAIYGSVIIPGSSPPPVFPSFMVAENQTPPYVVADVRETECLQAIPFIDSDGIHWQLCADLVDLCLYGFQNNEALIFQDKVNQYSLQTGNMGIMSAPVIVDDHRVQAELHGIAMKKTFSLRVSYYQQTSVSVALTLIRSSVPSFQLGQLAA